MTIREIRDAFMLKAKREAFKRKLELPEIVEKEIALMVSEAEFQVQNRLLIVESSATVAITDGVGTLPLNCGKIKAVKYENTFLQERSPADVVEFQSNQSASTPTVYARQSTGATETLLIYPLSTGNVTVHFYVNTLYYSPTAVTEYYGSVTKPFDGNAFSGNLLLPHKYALAIQYYMLSQYFDDFEIKYERELSLLKSSSERTLTMPKYQFGGLEEDGYYETRSQNASITTSGGGEVYSKHYKVYCEEGSTSFEVSKNTFGLISPSLTNNILTITTSAEFTQGKTFVECTRDCTWDWISASEIKITIYPESGWEKASIEVYL